MNRTGIIFFFHMLLSAVGCYLIIHFFSVSVDFVLVTIISFFVSFIVLWLLSYLFNRKYFNRIINAFYLIIYFIKEFIRANLKLSYEILSVRLYLEPAVVAVPLDIKADLGIMILANLITLTPGTLSLEVSDDRKYLYVHTLYLEGGIEQFKDKIKKGFEQKIIAITQ